jgi:hypothetical protein
MCGQATTEEGPPARHTDLDHRNGSTVVHSAAAISRCWPHPSIKETSKPYICTPMALFQGTPRHHTPPWPALIRHRAAGKPCISTSSPLSHNPTPPTNIPHRKKYVIQDPPSSSTAHRWTHLGCHGHLLPLLVVLPCSYPGPRVVGAGRLGAYHAGPNLRSWRTYTRSNPENTSTHATARNDGAHEEASAGREV